MIFGVRSGRLLAKPRQLVLLNSWRCRSCKPESSGVNDSNDHVSLDDSRGGGYGATKFQKRDVSWFDKVLYSSYLEKYIPPAGYRKRMADKFEMKELEAMEVVEKTGIMPPISIKYYLDVKLGNEDSSSSKTSSESSESQSSDGEQKPVIQFPYKILSKTEFTEETEGQSFEPAPDDDKSVGSFDKMHFESVADRLRRHSIDVDDILEDKPSIADMFETAVDHSLGGAGTPDPNRPPSLVPCGGCGALLHCQNESIPGYISSEKFKRAKKQDLMGEVCYRCSVLEAHKASLNVNVSSEDYPKIVSKIKEKFAMVVLMVDLTDFPCSVWPGILEIIGYRRPIILVGNKVDLLPKDSEGYLKHIESSLIKCAVDVGMLEANILHTTLISAKTGYGVENLISTIFNIWKSKGDIFIMGCTNVGKSSLFNMFLQSDLCKPQVSDLVQRATISPWPGTTLNLLKFPMTNPSGWRKALRYRRLEAEKPVLRAENKERSMELQMTGNAEYAILAGHVGQTFISEQKLDAMEKTEAVNDIFQVNPLGKHPPRTRSPGQWNPDDRLLMEGNWVYDTPGAVSSNQILDLLTLPELMEALPTTLIQPRSFFIKPGMSFFVGGLARIDFDEGAAPIRYTVFSNTELPITMVLKEDADEVYEKAIGSKVFGVPAGSRDRIEQFPPLVSKTAEFKGEGHGCSCVDFVLSSIGWVAVSAGQRQNFKVSIHTPNGKGIFVRTPSLLPYAVRWKGKRIRGTYAYLPHKLFMSKSRF